MRSSAPGASRIVRESICDAMANAMRLGKLALIRPVTTLTDGRWVASTMWMPTARPSGPAARSVLDVLALAHHQVGQLVDDDDDVRHAVRRVDARSLNARMRDVAPARRR